MNCRFKVECNGNFVRCNALVVGKCPKNCKFAKTEQEFLESQKQAENILMKRNKIVVEKIVNGVNIVSTETLK